MALNDELVRSFFEQPGFSAALFRGGTEITTPGYQRYPISSWAVELHRASAGFSWQMDSYTVFDEIVIFRAGKVVDRQPFGGDVTLPPKAVFNHAVSVRVDG